jgi:aminoglycoside phosphotransferase (APT) family kinase protein
VRVTTAPPGLGPVRSAHRFDEGALARWLREQLPDVTEPLTVQQFEGGQSNPTFLVSSGERQMVLRKKPPGVLLPSAHAVEREYAVLRALHGTKVPVPQPLALCEDATVVGTPFYLMEYVRGYLHWNVTLPEASVDERRAVYADFVRTLAAIHGLDYAARGLAQFGKPTDYLARQVQRWSQQFAASRTGDSPAMEALAAWLPAHLPSDDQTSLIHGDFRVDNLIVSPDGRGRVLAVLDWELSTLGNPLADLAHACMPYHLALPGGRGNLYEVDVRALGIPTEDELLDAYCAESGRKRPVEWPWLIAFVLFRMGAILQGVYKRSLQGNASSAQAQSYGAAVELLAQRGCETVGVSTRGR